jgi:glucose/arabinose dehydrogenase
MKPKRWFAAVGVVVFAYLVAVFDMAFTWPLPQLPSTVLAPTGALGVSFADFANGFNQPVALAVTGIETDTRLFVVERPGVIRIAKSDGAVLPAPFLDISSKVEDGYGEQGLLGLAFAPDYISTGRFFVYYTSRLNPANPSDGDILNIARYQVSVDPNIAGVTETTVLTITHPNNLNHNGGDLQFGPDGYLYAGTGDGGSGGDPPNNAQNKGVLLGKLLRLNVTGVPTYTIPATNPFTQTANARPEIWAFGLRNPWRFSFDRGTGELYIGDVGQGLYEEVDYEPAGAGGRNYGWHCYEGFHDYLPSDCVGVTGIISPVTEYGHNASGGDAIVGGYVYRGSQYPSLDGLYFFTDNGSGNVWAMRTCSWQVTPLGGLLNGPGSFGEDTTGQLYVANLGDGTVRKLIGPAIAAAQAVAPLGAVHLFLPLLENNSACS